MFGATCSPFILNATLFKHLDENNTEISETMKQYLDVDNIMSSVNTKDDAIAYFKEARDVMSAGGFNLRSWSSNSSELMDEAIEENEAEKETTFKTLGVEHGKRHDVFPEGESYGRYGTKYYAAGSSQAVISCI